MEDKKNVSFTSGLALLLSIVALVLIGWRGIADSPAMLEYKEAIDGKLVVHSDKLNQFDEILRNQADALTNGKLSWQYFKLQELDAKLGELLVAGTPQYKGEVQALQNQVKVLMAKISAQMNIPKVPAKIAPPFEEKKAEPKS